MSVNIKLICMKALSDLVLLDAYAVRSFQFEKTQIRSHRKFNNIPENPISFHENWRIKSPAISWIPNQEINRL